MDEAPVKGLIEGCFLGPDHQLDMGLLLSHLREGLPHGVPDNGNKLIDERFMKVQHPAKACGPAEDPAEHIAPTLVRGERTVRDGKAEHPNMVRDDPVWDGILLIRGAGQPF